MERVAFLVERTGERISCLLNPETLTVQRRAGIAMRSPQGPGPVHTQGLTDDPLTYTGAGSTELVLDLLFDTTLSVGSVAVVEDVRRMTAPLSALAEHAADPDGRLSPPFVRFLWGLSWNIPGVIASIAERLESFTPAGVPRRSWLRMRLLRVTPPHSSSDGPPITSETLATMRGGVLDASPPSPPPAGGSSESPALEIVGGPDASSSAEAGTPTRLDELAQRAMGDARLWRLIAWANDLADPLRVAAGTALRLPPRVAEDPRR